MGRYVISSITELPNSSCQWELVTPEGTILLLTYATGELTLCEWVTPPDSRGRDGGWEEVWKRSRDDLPVLQRMRDCHVSLDEAITMLGDEVAVTSYVASYELTSPTGYGLISSTK